MKRVLLIVTCFTFFAACSSDSEKSAISDTSVVTTDKTAVVSADTTTGVVDNPPAPPSPPVGKDEPAKGVTEAPVKETPAPAQSSTKGKELMVKSDCYQCHRDQEKIVGPAYVDVAKKYPATPANIEALAQKVIKGGSGVWGQIQMLPHPNVSVEDAREMVKYVLSLK